MPSTEQYTPALAAAKQFIAPKLVATTSVVQTGTFYYGYVQNPTEWHLNTGSGPRTFDAEIKFPTPYASPPVVMIAMTGLDSGGNPNTRITLTSGDVTSADFEIVASTWSDSIVYSVFGTWIAIGSV
jgi:hypothetical protein